MNPLLKTAFCYNYFFIPLRKRLHKSLNYLTMSSFAITMQPLLETNSHSLTIGTLFNETTFEQLHKRYRINLLRYAYSLTRSTHTSEEIVSEVFLRCWKNREKLQIQASVYGYLISSTRNMAIDYLRSNTRSRKHFGELVGDYASCYANPVELVIGKETHLLIERAITSLSPQCRSVFRMSRDREMSYAEIADELGLSIKTVEVHMGRALKFLRQYLKKERHN